jgi:putative nucleotidyltransferase with HDIG domain
LGRPAHRFSLFSRKIDHVAFVAFFLGGVLPLAVLVFVTQRYVLDRLPPGPAVAGAIGLVFSLGALSLGSFLALRRSARHAIQRLDEDRRRVEVLLDAAQGVAEAGYGEDVLCTLAACSARLTGADLSMVLMPGEKVGEEAPLGLTASAGEGALDLHARLGEWLGELVGPVLERGVPALWSREGRPDALPPVPLHAVAAVALVEEGVPCAVLVAIRTGEGRPFDATDLRSLSTLTALGAVARHNADLRDAQRNFYVHVTEMLIAALDTHMDLQAGHSRRVAHLAVQMGRELGFEERRLERLHFAALLHDIGILRIDTKQPFDRALYRQHPGLAFRMLSRIRIWQDIAPMVLHHHEWWSGEGYPEGLVGEDIPLESRIIAIAEAFDSMTSRSSYRPALPVEKALQQIEQHAGTQFDPQLARVFLDLAQRGLVTAES